MQAIHGLPPAPGQQAGIQGSDQVYREGPTEQAGGNDRSTDTAEAGASAGAGAAAVDRRSLQEATLQTLLSAGVQEEQAKEALAATRRESLTDPELWATKCFERIAAQVRCQAALLRPPHLQSKSV